MTDSIIAEIKTRVSCLEFLQKSERGQKTGTNGYVCYLCGSGTGQHKTGAVSFYPDENKWYCHACGKGGDVIDLFQAVSGCDQKTALYELSSRTGVRLTQGENRRQKQQTQNFTRYFANCRQRINDREPASYLKDRGISLETAERYGLGFDPCADPANNPGGTRKSKYPCPRIIVPTSAGGYASRCMDTTTPAKFAKTNSKGSAAGITGLHFLYNHDAREVFVCEGIFDAMSCGEAGAAAVALNSKSNAPLLLQHLREKRTDKPLILALDNDAAGKKATEILRIGLSELGIFFVEADIAHGFKDPNDALVADREAFFRAVEQARHKTNKKPDNTFLYLETIFLREIAEFGKEIKTGFSNLDQAMGGLYTGIYILGAVPSLGKTSFSLQIADQLAVNGNDVLFFSLEQSRLELVTKSISRILAEWDNSSQITSLAIRKSLMTPRIEKAMQEYKERVADRLSIIEAGTGCTISFVGNYVQQYITRTDIKPIVIIDYLQIVEPEQVRLSDKEKIDFTITSLKRLSREHSLTILAISSLNRANYLAPISFESFKESGGIEYGADVILGMQLQCIHDPVFDKQNNLKERREAVQKAKDANPRKIELTCLKNRFGRLYACNFDYYPQHDLFNSDGIVDVDGGGKIYKR